LSKYYSEIDAHGGAGRTDEITDQYYRIVTSENFLSQMDDLAGRCRRVARALPHDYGEHVERELGTYGRVNVVLTLRGIDYRRCECGRLMTLVPEMSELRCDCGKISVISGHVGCIDAPDNMQRSKSTGYDFT